MEGGFAMCDECGKLDESSNNYFVNVGSSWSYLSKKRVMEANNGKLVTPLFPDTPLALFLAKKCLEEAIKEGAALAVPVKKDE